MVSCDEVGVDEFFQDILAQVPENVEGIRIEEGGRFKILDEENDSATDDDDHGGKQERSTASNQRQVKRERSTDDDVNTQATDSVTILDDDTEDEEQQDPDDIPLAKRIKVGHSLSTNPVSSSTSPSPYVPRQQQNGQATDCIDLTLESDDDDAGQDDAGQDDAGRGDANRDDATRDEATRDEADRGDVIRNEADRGDVTRNDADRNDVSNGDYNYNHNHDRNDVFNNDYNNNNIYNNGSNYNYNDNNYSSSNATATENRQDIDYRSDRPNNVYISSYPHTSIRSPSSTSTATASSSSPSSSMTAPMFGTTSTYIMKKHAGSWTDPANSYQHPAPLSNTASSPRDTLQLPWSTNKEDTQRSPPLTNSVQSTSQQSHNNSSPHTTDGTSSIVSLPPLPSSTSSPLPVMKSFLHNWRMVMIYK